jgi:hypothetical protein
LFCWLIAFPRNYKKFPEPFQRHQGDFRLRYAAFENRLLGWRFSDGVGFQTFKPEEFRREGLEENLEFALIVARDFAGGKGLERAISGEQLPFFTTLQGPDVQVQKAYTHSKANAGDGTHLYLSESWSLSDWMV